MFVFRPWPGGNENRCGETRTVQDSSREADFDGLSGTNCFDTAHANQTACQSRAPEACFKNMANTAAVVRTFLNPTALRPRQCILQIFNQFSHKPTKNFR